MNHFIVYLSFTNKIHMFCNSYALELRILNLFSHLVNKKSSYCIGKL